ncbi:MAG: aldehyde dehydrogenase [Deltaproteobacteria bacterium]|nr:aldehyde dehydrogenase [Deltaproteobacteria bacterium]
MSEIKPLGDYIDGRFVKRRQAHGTLISRDPCHSKQLVGEFPRYDEALPEALSAARAAFGQWSKASLDERIAPIRKLRAQLQNRGEDLAQLTARETGRPLWDAREDVVTMRQQLDVIVRHGLAEIELQGPPPQRTEVSFHPRGVVAVIAPCSQPALLLHLDTIAALTVGCTVVCKPSPLTPALGQLYAELIHEADFPRGVFNLVQGDDECGQHLASDANVDVVLFSGSHQSARALRDAVIADSERWPLLRLHSSALPGALVLDDADLDQATSAIVIGACASNGLRCTNTHIVVAQQRIAARLQDQLLATLSRINTGESMRADTFLGPLPSEDHLKRFEAGLTRLRSQSDELLLGGRHEQRGDQGHYITPALFRVDAGTLRALSRDEILGPVLLFATVDDADEGAKLLAHAHRQLCHSVFTHDPDVLAQMHLAAPGSVLLINQPTTRWLGDLPLEPHQPLGGSLAHGSLTARSLVEPSVLVENDSAFDATTLPPGIPRPV